MADENTNSSGSSLPENASVNEAVELMSGFADDEDEGGAGNEPAEDDGEPQQDDDQPLDEGEGEDEAEPQAPSDGADAPEFWSAEDKAAWVDVPTALKPLLAKYEQQRVEFANSKAREASDKVKAADERARTVADVVDQAAAWWRQAGPAINRAFGDKWAHVNWAELAEKNPPEWARLSQLRADEAALLAEANRRGQADLEAAQVRAVGHLQEAKGRAHQVVATRHPEFFGTPEKAVDTYTRLADFLHSKGIPVEQINLIHEAPIIELALMAYRFSEVEKKASATLNGKPQNPAGNGAPRRVQPGPPSGGNRVVGENVRQARDRFRKSGDMRDAARLLDQLGH